MGVEAGFGNWKLEIGNWKVPARCGLRVTSPKSKVQSASYGMLSLSSLRLEPNALRLESWLRVTGRSKAEIPQDAGLRVMNFESIYHINI